MPHRFHRRTKSILTLGFAIIVVCIATLGFVEYAQEMSTRRAIARIQQNALVSVQLAHRIGDDIHSERQLLDMHVFEHDLASMHRIEKAIDGLRADYETAARAYESLPAPPEEVIAWRALTSDVAIARVRIDPVLELSRDDRTDEAAHSLMRLDALYDKIASEEAELDGINDAEAHFAVDDVRRIQATALDLRLALLGVVLASVVLVGSVTSSAAVRAQKSLGNLNDALAARNRDLDAFAGRLAHDLRGPLSSIGLANEVIAQRFPDARPTTTKMERSITQISNLLDELLTLSRLGTMPKGSARAESLAVTLSQRLEPLVTEVDGSIHVDLQPATIACSEGLLSQVLWNLGENAVKYRRPDTPPAISITGRAEGSFYRIVVSDNAMGMTETDARCAFEPFFRGKHTAIPGTGLGLSIVRRIIEATHGTISLESQLGVGSTFTISIPLASSNHATDR